MPLVDAPGSTAYKHDRRISFHRFPLGNAVLLNLVNFVMSLSYHSVLVAVFIMARCAEPLASYPLKKMREFIASISARKISLALRVTQLQSAHTQSHSVSCRIHCAQEHHNVFPRRLSYFSILLSIMP